MIRRLVEAHHFAHRDAPNSDQIAFWLQELRTPSLLIGTARAWPDAAREILFVRPLVQHALTADESALAAALEAEERTERLKDRDYWLPLKAELERLRRIRMG